MNHGTVKQYLAGCRCDECRAANTAYYREYRAKKLAEDPDYYRRANRRYLDRKKAGETGTKSGDNTGEE